ncbi:MAG: flagellar hook-basal body protein [Lachnospiraceae bacterium]|nr:flagellar hook-basal body protein [Lachnospiraceae bacterium]
MVRSLWTAATGMIAQQNNVDTIANNLANVNTTGYKTETNEFKSLLYQNIQTRTSTANGDNKPIGAQVGLGVRNASITSQFTQGSLLESESNTAFAISGKGFFAVRGEDGQTYYTRNGDFNFSLGPGGTLQLSTSDGQQVLSSQGVPITMPATVNGEQVIANKIVVSADGAIMYPDANNNPQPVNNLAIGLFQFQNPKGLNKVGDSLYEVSAASGPALNEATNAALDDSVVRQGYLENSNVQVADEMVNLIIAQRAYELNSKAIQATDEMLQQANQLR